MTPVRVAVCICTYRRPAQLDQLLQALAKQQWSQMQAPAVNVVVVENEAIGPGKEVCRKRAVESKLAIQYAVEPRPGVPIARNRCLDIAEDKSDFISFIDDDEIPAPDWLEQLLLLQRSSGADVVAGPVFASFTIPPPAWLSRGHFHDSGPPSVPRRPTISRKIGGLFSPSRIFRVLFPLFSTQNKTKSGSSVYWFGTGNVLLRTDIIRDKKFRFEESFRHYGYGADTLFSRRIALAGYRIVWSNEAIVGHIIPPARMTVRWLMRRALQQGYCATLIDMTLAKGSSRRTRIALLGCAAIAINFFVLPFDVLAGRHHVVWRFLCLCRYVGRCAGALGLMLQYDRRENSEALKVSEISAP
jgi:GT2 family glycosyltransferase